MPDFAHLSTRLFNRPLAITERHAEIVMSTLGERLGITHLFSGNALRPAAGLRDLGMDDDDRYRPYDVQGGIAHIPVCGTLVQKLGTLRPVCGMTGYDGIRANLSMALEDPDVQAIALDIDSPGGEVAGCFDLVDDIYAARGTKPLWAILSESAYSAGYAIASAADRIVVPRTGGTGSVGVICMHVDMSKALGQAGLKVTLIQYGSRKADGASEQPLSDEALSRFQADVDAMGELFVATVARNRNMSPAAVRETQAGTFMGGQGVDIGFADAVMSPADAFAALAAKVS